MSDRPILTLASFTAATYEAHRRLDPAGLQPSFGEWQQSADALQKAFEDQGFIVARVDLDPDDLLAFCAARGMTVGRQARQLLAIEIFARRDHH